MAVLVESGISVYHVAVDMATAVQASDLVTENARPATLTLINKWQCYLAHIAVFVVFFSGM